MRFSRMILSAAAVGVLALPAMSSLAQTTATTNPVGFLQVQCLSNSDTLVAIPFARPPAFTGAVAAVNGASKNVISFSTAPGFTASQFVYAPTAATPITDNFYLSVGPATAALTGTLTVTQNSPVVTGTGTTFSTQLVAGDRITINDGANSLTYTLPATPTSATSLTLDRAYVDAAATSTTGLSATYDHSPYEGRWYMVTANDASTVTVDLNGDNLSALPVGTQVSIIPYWTLSTIFPDSDAGVSYTATTGRAYSTQILIPTYASTAVPKTQQTTLAASATYYYINSGNNVGWRITTDTKTNRGNDPLLPDGYFTVHNGNGAPSLPLTFAGSVVTQKLAVNLISQASVNQDNAFGLARPVPLTIGSLGLVPTLPSAPGAGSFVATTGRSYADLLYLYDNTKAGYNKAASATYYYNSASGNTGWRLTSNSTADHSNDPVPAGSALVVRKVATGTQTVTELVDNPNY